MPAGTGKCVPLAAAEGSGGGSALWARRMGVGYLLNAALCPLGWLLAAFVSFDTDFILLAQIVGLLLVSLLGFAPLLNTGKTSA